MVTHEIFRAGKIATQISRANNIPSLKLTAEAPKNGWLEYDPSSFSDCPFSGAFAVSFRECNHSAGAGLVILSQLNFQQRNFQDHILQDQSWPHRLGSQPPKKKLCSLVSCK